MGPVGREQVGSSSELRQRCPLPVSSPAWLQPLALLSVQLLCSTRANHAAAQQGGGLALGAGLESSKKKIMQNKAVVLRKVKPTPFLHKYHQGHGG